MPEFAYLEVVRVRATPQTVADAVVGLEGAVLVNSRNADGRHAWLSPDDGAADPDETVELNAAFPDLRMVAEDVLPSGDRSSLG